MATYRTINNKKGAHYNPVYLDVAGKKVYGKQKCASPEEAKAFALSMEEFLSHGGVGEISPQDRADMTIKRLFNEHFAKSGHISSTTMTHYRGQMERRIFPQYGQRHPNSVSNAEVLIWLMGLNVSTSTRRATRAAMGALMSFAIKYQWRDASLGHPVKGIGLPKPKPKSKRPLTTVQIIALYGVAVSYGAELLMRTDVKTGLRFEEITALRVYDFHYEDRYFQIERTVIRPGREDNPNPDGGVIEVNDTKNHEPRPVTMDQELADEIQQSIIDRNLGPEDLLFPDAFVRPARPGLSYTIPTFGLYTRPGKGTTHPHGTKTAYSYGCRCDHCKLAMSEYRAYKRVEQYGFPVDDQPRDPHLAYNWWNDTFHDMCEAIGAPLPDNEGFHILRHTHGSHMYAATKDRHFVMRRLGHSDIKSTMIYIHALTDFQYPPDDIMASIGRNAEVARVPEDMTKEERMKLVAKLDSGYDPYAEPPAVPPTLSIVR